jgi:hypothetical protein
VDSNNAAESWVERTFKKQVKHGDGSLQTWLLGRGGVVESVSLSAWEKTLMWSTPLFQFLEGFCSLLVIQACGQITRWLVNRERGDSWMVSCLSPSFREYSGLTRARLASLVSPPQSSPARYTSSGA